MVCTLPSFRTDLDNRFWMTEVPKGPLKADQVLKTDRVSGQGTEVVSPRRRGWFQPLVILGVSASGPYAAKTMAPKASAFRPGRGHLFCLARKPLFAPSFESWGMELVRPWSRGVWSTDV
jgi:hypothetical protein